MISLLLYSADKKIFMIQRIQTLFLLCITGISITLLFIPFVEYSTLEGKVSVDLLPDNTSNLTVLYYLPVVLNLINLVLSVVVVLQFKRRIIQLKMASLLMAFNAILLGVMLLFDFVQPSVSSAIPAAKTYLAGSYLPIVSILFAFLAIKFIRKDEELVRSADRLR